ncbi:MAG: glycosyltransferase 87 family protein [Pseudomonadota bacterium]
MSRPLAAAALVLLALSAAAVPLVDAGRVSGYVALMLAHAAAYVAVVWLVIARPPRRLDLALILVVAAALRLVALHSEPALSTDGYRYVWDGRVQAAGFNPYALVPADERLAHLRDATIYPNINQKETAITIYPPMAEIVFLAANRLSDGLAGMRLLALLLEAITIAALLAWLGSDGLPRERVVIYAWHPLPIWELTSQAHVDVAAIALLVVAIVTARRGRQGITGCLLAAATLVKYFPLVLLPALWRRWNWRLPAAFAATAAALYAPYALGTGSGVAGFLGRHLDNEGYAAGWGFHVVWMLRDLELADPPGRLYIAAALAVLAALSLVALLRRGADEMRPEHLLLLATAFVWLTSPHYPWYFAWLVALLVRVPHPAVLAMTLLAVVLQVPRPPGGPTWTTLLAWTYYAPLLAAVAYEAWRRRTATR